MANFTTTGSNTFRAGIVIQQVSTFVDQPSHVTLSAGGFTVMGGIHMLAITPKDAGSKLFMWATCHPYGSGSGGVNTCAYDFYDTRTSAWLGAIGTANGGVSGYFAIEGYSAGPNVAMAGTTSGTTAARTYKLGMRNPDSNTLYDHNDGIFAMTISEIMQ